MANQIPPKVTVCMPVYNGSTYIAGGIESVLNQTYKDFELIVSDNCSTDNTEAIVRGFRDPRIRYFRNDKNLGPIGNTNRCLDLARGEYINIFHHDDEMMPENLACKVGLLDQYPEVGFVHSNIFVTDAEGKVLWQWNEDSRRDYIEDGIEVFHRYLNRMHSGALIFIGAVLARRTCYERVGRYRLEVLPHTYDNEMWLRMALFYKVGCVGKPLVSWRQHSATESSEWGMDIAWLEEHFLATRIIFKEYQTHIPNWERLKREVGERFSKEALKRGIRACGKDDFKMGKEYMRLAIKYSKDSRYMKDFWGLTLRLILGPKTARLFRPIKRKIREFS